jgi:hypothetical protein
MAETKELRGVTIGGRTSFLDPDTGQQFWVDAQDASRAVQAGFQPETSDAFLARRRRGELETPGAQLETGLLGVARGVSLGASDVALRALAPELASRARELRAVNPALSGASELAGTVASVFTPGAPLRAISGGARAAAAAATRGLEAGGRAAQLAGRIATGAAGAAAEGAALGTGAAVSEAALSGETRDLLDRIVAQSESGAMTGLGVAAGLGAAGAALKGLGSLSKAAGKRVAKAAGIPQITGAEAETAIAQGQTQIATLREGANVIESDAQLLAKVSTPRVREILTRLRGSAEDIEAAGGESALRAELRDLTLREAKERGIPEIIATGGFQSTSGVAPHALQIELGKLYTEIGNVGKRVRAATGVDITSGATRVQAGGSRLASALADEAGYRVGGKLGAKLARFVAEGGISGSVLGSPQIQAVARTGAQVARLGADQLAVAMAGEIRRREAYDATYELPAAPERLPEILPQQDAPWPLPALLAERQRLQQTIGDLPLESAADREILTGQISALSTQIRSRLSASATAQTIRAGGVLPGLFGSVAGKPGERSLSEGTISDVIVGSLISGQRGPVVELLTGHRAKGAEAQLAALAQIPPVDEALLEQTRRALTPIDANEYQSELARGYEAAGLPQTVAQALAQYQGDRVRYLKQRLQGGPIDAWRALQAARDVRPTFARLATGRQTAEDVAFIAETLPRLRVQLQLVARQLKRSGRRFDRSVDTALAALAGGRFARRERAAGLYIQRNIFGNAPVEDRAPRRPLPAAQMGTAAPVEALARSLGG